MRLMQLLSELLYQWTIFKKGIIKMKIKAGKEKDFETFVEVNSKDAYSLGVVNYMKRWAELMEKEIENGSKLVDIADRTSHIADTEGITGFMYGCVVRALSEFWEHGEELRKWHNKKYNYEGDGTVNPAIITV